MEKGTVSFLFRGGLQGRSGLCVCVSACVCVCLDLGTIRELPRARRSAAAAAPAVGGAGGGGVGRELALLVPPLAPHQQDDHDGDQADEEDKTGQPHQHGQGGGVQGLPAGAPQEGPLQEGLALAAGGPGLALADHHAVGAIQSDVLDVGAPAGVHTNVLG